MAEPQLVLSFKQETSEPRRYTVEMYASAVIVFTHLYTTTYGAL